MDIRVSRVSMLRQIIKEKSGSHGVYLVVVSQINFLMTTTLRKLDVVLFCQLFACLHKFEVVISLNEVNNVTFLSTAKAVEYLFLLVDHKGWCLLIVKGTQSLVIATSTLEGDFMSDDIYNIDFRFNLIYKIAVECHSFSLLL